MSRGTASYRAPEILNSISQKYDKKADIFALGCIVYEIATEQKLFCNDFAIITYLTKGTLHSVWWPKATKGNWDSLERLVASMLEIHYRKRPGAKEIQKNLKDIRAGICSRSVQSGPPIQVSLFIILH